MKIGVFDSGFGGLTVLKALHAALPSYDFVYLGDNARTPYGDRSPETIYEFTRQGVEWLFQHGCALVVIACNTASAHALPRLQTEWLPAQRPDRILTGVISPMIDWLSQNHTSQKVGLIGTRATVASGAYPVDIAIACPLLVPLIEEGWHATAPAMMILRKYLRPIKLAAPDILILGCTHYPLLAERITRIMGHRTHVINPGAIIAEHAVALILDTPQLNARLQKNNEVSFFTTDSAVKFAHLATRFWGAPLSAEKISISEL